MSRTGPLPKPEDQRQRRNKPTSQSFDLSSDGSLVGPDLPSDKTWTDAARAFYDGWRASPQARAMEDTDFIELTICTILYQAIYANPRVSAMLAAELRQRVSRFGATIEDRQRLRMHIEHGDELVPDDVSAITDFRSRFAVKPDSDDEAS